MSDYLQIHEENDVILRLANPEAVAPFVKLLKKLQKAHKKPGFLKTPLTKAESVLLTDLLSYFKTDEDIKHTDK